ncbi:MAG TPA: type I restriction-modification system subunit M [bacterium]|jgi:type I restriction enzyme M protein
MNEKVNQSEINDIAWKACDTFRGSIDPAQYKDYILVMLFIKYMSDLGKDKREQYADRYKGDKERIERALSRERFVVPQESDFDFLYSKRRETNIGEIINIALDKIEDANKSKLEDVFRNIDFNSQNLGETKERNRRLISLLEDFNNPKLDLRPSRIGNYDIIGNTYEYLISRFASDAGKKGGEFYTPGEVAMLLAELLEPNPGDKISDPACGSGSLLIKVAKKVGSNDFALFGMESNGSTWALCRMNMFLHEMDNARIEWCNTITNPRLVDGDSLIKFNIVVANPPFSLDKWGVEIAESDKYNRFWRGIPPKSKGDYAFISHMVETALEGEGKVGVIVPHGVLFRGGAEGKIRQKMIEENLLKAVIGLPANLFFGTGIPAAILIFDKGKGKNNTDVLFIDASREFLNGKNQNKLRETDIAKIVKTFKDFATVEKYSYRATVEEITENDFNLNIPRYVDTFEEEEEVDISAVMKEIEGIEAELAVTRKEMDRYLKELGFKNT